MRSNGFNYYHYYDYYYKFPDRLDDLSEKIKTRFEAENAANVTTLYDMSLASEERATVMDLGNPATQLGRLFHFRDHVCQEEHLAIT